MKTFLTLQHFEKKLKKGVCWGDWIKVGGRQYKMVEYGGGSLMKMSYDYMLFQNKPTTNIIRVCYHCPSIQHGLEVVKYQFISIEEYINGELYRY